MKNITKSIIALFAVVAFSCTVQDVQDRPVIEGVDSPVLTAPTSGAAYVLSPANAAAQAERFTWKSANFGGDVQVTYAVEMDKKGNAFKTPQSIGSVISANQVSVSVESMNKAALLLKATPFSPGEFEVRVKSSAGALAAMYSNVVGIVVTPYTTENPKLWVPGGYAKASGYPNDWDPATSPQLSASGYGKVDFEGYVNFNDANAEYKFTSFPEWKGEFGAGATAGTLDPKGANLKIPAAGYYQIVVDTEKLTYKATATSWGIIGSATAGGWDNSTAMTYNKTTKLWSVTATLTGAEFKFRANNGWDINLGKLKTAPDGSHLEYGGDNIAVAAGNYTITLDLSSPRNYKYTITKN
ncbi:SusE domain-containing protein [Flavobacterium xinjiangense]|uniref:SusE outer membrane protein n=1 Tax=Flavobacterium xinjiangense TaxID=178356 RepID=A0A1M7FR32_9FLAO|nr:SusE domain-containing protein [Flavobacterium xinjiangense]SHM06238.1 SusE outer membrane protein [Flavobacterium xinjiangense]